MRRDEIRIFRGDVENYIERLRALSHQTLLVEFEESPRRVIPAANVLHYSRVGSRDRIKSLMSRVVEVTSSLALWAVGLTVMAFLLAPLFQSVGALMEVSTLLALLILVWKILAGWGRWDH